MSEEIKTTAEFLDEAMTNTPEQTEAPEVEATNDATTSDEKEVLEVYLASGITLNINYDEMNWQGIWENARDDLINNSLATTTTCFKLASETDEKHREELALDAIETVTKFFKSVGVPEINYDLRPDLSIVEKALIMLYDSNSLITTILRVAEVEVLTAPTHGMTIDQMINMMSDQMSNFHFGNPDNKNEN